MRPLGSERWPDGLIAAAAAFALAGALLNNFLRFNGYPFFQPEVGLVAIIALMGAVLFGLVYHLLRRRAVIPRSLLEGLLIAFAVSMQIDGPWLLLALGLATAIFVWKFKRSTLPFVGLASAVTIAVSTAGIGQQTQDFIDGPGLRSAAQGTPRSDTSSHHSG